MPRSHRLQRVSLPDIHHAVALVSQAPLPQQQDSDDASLLPLFHDSLHVYSIHGRPTTKSDLADLVHLVTKLIELCGTRKLRWKAFILTSFLRRYHGKAPEARSGAGHTDDADHTDSVGDGERLIFYGTLLTLHRYWLDHNSHSDGVFEQAQLAHEAAAAMIRIATRIGGSRDLCTIIQHLAAARLFRGGYLEEEEAPDSFAEKLVPAVHAMIKEPDDLLCLAVQLAACQLDDDLDLLSPPSKTNKDDPDSLLSTIHVMIPHNKRGTNTKGAWKRKLANSVSEILIWQRTRISEMDSRFSRAMGKFEGLPVSAIDEGHALIQQMQTTARKQRQLLNDHARRQGFLLTSSYLMDKTSLSFRQIRRAKAGDLHMLTKLARKNRDSRVLTMISKRNLDPSKATVVSSIQELVRGWIDTSQDYEGDEIGSLELAMQTSTVEATLSKLRVGPRESTRPVWITCIDTDKTSDFVCSVLLAAVLDQSRLFLAGELQDVSTTANCIDLLNQIILHNKFAGANSMSVEDMLLSRMEPSQDVLVLSSRDLELDETVLQEMHNRDITIRVHATERVETFGKVELCLNSTIYDRIKARGPISLGVVLDCTGSMGSEIEGCKKGALSMISTFRELTPVQSFNFMGYWDPVSVRGDPQPKSTGYLEANKTNLELLQAFVNKELVCQGGGDEPEDIPKALEMYVADMKKAGLSADNSVHFLFFIADAGFRPNETARIEAAMQQLKKLGVVMVVCRVRGGQSLQTMVTKTKECFKGVGQYVELNDMGQLDSIAASVTESIRASLFSQSNVVSVTSSVGSTIDAICKVASFQHDHGSLKKTEALVKLPPDDTEIVVDEKMELEGGESKDEKVKADEVAPAIRVLAEKKEFTLTSRDRLYLQLSRLPSICHEQVVAAFGGKSLQEISAKKIADQLRDENLPLSDLQKAGYPRDMIDLVQNIMAGYGIERVDD